MRIYTLRCPYIHCHKRNTHAYARTHTTRTCVHQQITNRIRMARGRCKGTYFLQSVNVRELPRIRFAVATEAAQTEHLSRCGHEQDHR